MIMKSEPTSHPVQLGEMTPKQIVQELDRYVIGQRDAKRMVAIALRNRWRRQQLSPELREEITGVISDPGKNNIFTIPRRNYIGKFWIDSITHDADYLRFCLNSVGSSRICLGTDYPFPLGDLEMGRFIEEMDLPASDLHNIMYRSTSEWLGRENNPLDRIMTKSVMEG